MALAKDFDKYGTTFTAAYHKVMYITANITQGYQINVYVYFNQAASDNGDEALAQKTYTIPYQETILDGNGDVVLYDNPIKFAYGLLKLQPEYATAVDV